MTTYLPKNINIQDISIGDIKVSDNGSKSAYISYKNSQINLQTPKLVAAFTLSKYGQDKDKIAVVSDVAEKYTLQLSLANVESNASIGYFHKFLKDLDDFAINTGVENSKAWFKKAHDKEVIKEFYSSSITIPKDKTGEPTDKYPPTFRIGVQVQNGKVKPDCYNADGNPIELSSIEKGTEVTAILQFGSFWFTGNKFGILIRAISLKVNSIPTNFKAFAFKDDEDDDKTANGNGNNVDGNDADNEHIPNHGIEEEDEDNDEDQSVKIETAPPTTLIESSDDDGDEDDVEPPVVTASVPVPAKAAAPVKRVVKKK